MNTNFLSGSIPRELSVMSAIESFDVGQSHSNSVFLTLTLFLLSILSHLLFLHVHSLCVSFCPSHNASIYFCVVK